jgi:hypothetical protein
LTPAEKSWSRVRIKSYHYVVVRANGQRLFILAKTAEGKVIDRFEKIT